MHVLDDVVAVLGLVYVDGVYGVPSLGEDLGVADDGCEAGALLEAVHVDEVEEVFILLDGGDDAVVDSFGEVDAHVEAALLLGLEALELQFFAAAFCEEVLGEPGVDLFDELGFVLHVEHLGALFPFLL